MNPYQLRSDTVLDEDGKRHTTYGIEYRPANVSVKDVFLDKEKAAAFVAKCNALDLSPIHLYDVIEDAL